MREIRDAQREANTELEEENKQLKAKLNKIDDIVSDRFCDWDMARCRVDFIINEGE